MRALANYIMKGPLQAMLVASAFALFSLIPVVGVLSVFSGAAVALVTLRQGIKQGLTILVGASVITGLFLYLIFKTMALGFVFALLLWLPMLVLAQVLRFTRSWSITLDVAAGLGIIAVAVVHIAVGDPIQFWQEVLNNLIDMMTSQGGGTELEVFREQLPLVAEWMTGMLAAAVVLSMIASTMIARWWQALLYNPGGFRQEFYGLRQSRVSAITVLIVLVLSILKLGTLSSLAGDVMIIAVIVYSVVGLGITHALVAGTGKHVGWLVALYVLMFLVPPHVMVVLAALGFADSWLNFRARLSNKPQA